MWINRCSRGHAGASGSLSLEERFDGLKRILGSGAYGLQLDYRAAGCDHDFGPGGVFVLSHPIGRTRVNEIHKEVHSPVKDDVLPELSEMLPLVNGSGFRTIRIIDEAAFFLLSFRK